jgi:hypothetical protein
MILEADGHRALGFDTGLDSRSFAQAKLAQLITEPGLIVCPAEGPRRIEWWKASGVLEVSGAGDKPTMVVWGPLFEGERLDLLLDEYEHGNIPFDKVLAAISAWIQAILALGENPPAVVSLRPCAATIAQKGGSETSVFFAPPSLAQRCITSAHEWHVHPDLDGMNGAAFTAAAMLYRLFTGGTPPFSADNESILHQDMREGNFLPLRFAVPGLNGRLSALMQEALDPVQGNKAKLLGEIAAVLQTDGPLIQDLAEAERLLLEKEKAQFLKIKTASVKTRRFVARNSAILLGCAAALVAAVFIAVSIAQSRSRLPSTAGMEPVQVIESYYNAIGELDHQMMEACVFGGAGKDDINMVINLFVINKTRQAYELRKAPSIISAREWQQGGEWDIDTQVFGVTDLHITLNQSTEETQYRVDYIFWVSALLSGEPETAIADNRQPRPYYRSDAVTLVRKKEKRKFNWRITEIKRG